MIPISTNKENCLFSLKRNEENLRKAVSDVAAEMEKLEQWEITQVCCECCGLKEDCTTEYIRGVKESHSGKWVCGLCAEAVKERRLQAPEKAMEEALSLHREFCQRYNITTRMNPKLSLTQYMRGIAKRSRESRSKIGRSSSCVPRFDLQ